MEGLDDAFADGGYVLENAAGEGEAGKPGWIAGVVAGLPDSLDDEAREVGKLLCFAAQDVPGYGVSLRGTLHHRWGEAGEVGRGNLVGVTDEGVEAGKLP